MLFHIMTVKIKGALDLEPLVDSTENKYNNEFLRYDKTITIIVVNYHETWNSQMQVLQSKDLTLSHHFYSQIGA